MNEQTPAQVMAGLLEMVTTFMSTLTTLVGQVITTITGQPYLMVGFAIVVISFAIGVVVRLVRRLGHNPA